jgi:hypothetical protein
MKEIYLYCNTLKDKNYVVKYGDQTAVSEIRTKYTTVDVTGLANLSLQSGL